jgi:hypothetical protein
MKSIRLLPSTFCFLLSAFEVPQVRRAGPALRLLTADCLLGVMSDAAIGSRPVDPPTRASHSDPE